MYATHSQASYGEIQKYFVIRKKLVPTEHLTISKPQNQPLANLILVLNCGLKRLQ